MATVVARPAPPERIEGRIDDPVDSTRGKMFLSLWFACCIAAYVIFPSWYLPTLAHPLALLISVTVYLAILFGLAHRMMAKADAGEAGQKSRLISTKESRTIGASLAICGLAHMPAMFQPISAGGDECYHTWYTLKMLEPVSSLLGRVPVLSLQLLAWIAFFALLVIAFIFLRDPDRKRVLLRVITGPGAAAFLLLAAFLVGVGAYQAFLRSTPYDLTLHRYPPLGKFPSFVAYSLFGVNEFAARLPSLVFSLGSGFFLWRIVRMFAHEKTALMSTWFLLLSPVFFFYGNLVYLETGAVFFILASMNWFLRYFRSGSRLDLGIAILSAGIGYLYKEYVVILFPIYMLILAHRWIRGIGLEDVRFTLLAFAISVASLLPWFGLQKFLGIRGLVFTPGNMSSFEVATRYLRNLPGQITLLVAILAIVGVVTAAVRRRNELAPTFAQLFVIPYLALTVDLEVWVGYPRYMTLLIPSIAVFAAIGLTELVDRARPNWHAVAIGACFVMLFFNVLLDMDDDPSEHGIDYFVPMDSFFSKITPVVEPTARVVPVSNFTPVPFYKDKHHAHFRIVGRSGRSLSISDPLAFSRWMKESHVNYAIVVTPRWMREASVPGWMPKSLREMLHSPESELLMRLDRREEVDRLFLVFVEQHEREGTLRLLRPL